MEVTRDTTLLGRLPRSVPQRRAPPSASRHRRPLPQGRAGEIPGGGRPGAPVRGAPGHRLRDQLAMSACANWSGSPGRASRSSGRARLRGPAPGRGCRESAVPAALPVCARSGRARRRPPLGGAEEHLADVPIGNATQRQLGSCAVLAGVRPPADLSVRPARGRRRGPRTWSSSAPRGRPGRGRAGGSWSCRSRRPCRTRRRR
jgi:hypothetical protein